MAKSQLEHLIHLARTDANITIQILPLRAGAHAGMDGPFMLVSFTAGRDTVAIEGARVLLHLHEPDTVEIYRTTSDHLKSDALGLKASLSLLNTIVKELS